MLTHLGQTSPFFAGDAVHLFHFYFDCFDSLSATPAV